jgi:hypothetical protein
MNKQHIYTVDVDFNQSFTFQIVSEKELSDSDIDSALNDNYYDIRQLMLTKVASDYEEILFDRPYAIDSLDQNSDRVLIATMQSENEIALKSPFFADLDPTSSK